MNKSFSFTSLLIFSILVNISVSAQVVTDSTAKDSILLKQIEDQMQATAPAIPEQTRSAATANPDLGVIGDFQAAYDSRGKKNFNAYLNETEVSLQSVVDPYVRADFFISFSRDPETHKYGVDIEEGYLTTLALPYKLQLKAGKFKEAVGRVNPVHSHALPFIDLPNAYLNYFGEEGLNDEGASLSWLLPTKSVYQELTFQATAGNGESPSFHRGDNNRFVYLSHLKNFFTLNDNATLELGVTGITGPADTATTNMGAADITYKWKPVRFNTYKSLTWQSEFFYDNTKHPDGSKLNSFGLYSMLQYQIAKRWFLTGRYDYAQKPYDKSIVEQAGSLTAGWLATEFQKIEVEAKLTDENVRPLTYEQVWLRWIFVIGAHGAHQY